MELEDFKNIWQTSQQREIYWQNVDNELVISMIKQKSKAVSDKLRRNLDIDMVVSSLFIPPLLYIIMWSKVANYHKLVAGFFLIYTVIGLIYYFRVLKLYKQIELKNDLLTTLKFTVNQFEKQVKTLTIYNATSIVPVMFYGSLVGMEISKYFRPSTIIELWILIIATMIMTPVGFLYMKQIINIFYGKHLKKLKEHLIELDEHQ